MDNFLFLFLFFFYNILHSAVVLKVGSGDPRGSFVFTMIPSISNTVTVCMSVLVMDFMHFL